METDYKERRIIHDSLVLILDAQIQELRNPAMAEAMKVADRVVKRLSERVKEYDGSNAGQYYVPSKPIRITGGANADNVRRF